MGNQQETLTQAEIGWLAGIIEGEGSITMNARKKAWKGWNGFGVDMHIFAVNTDAGIIEKAVSIIRKMGVEPYVYERSCSPIPRRRKDGTYCSEKTMLTISISKMNDILAVIDHIIDHIAGEKKSRANLIRQFILRRIERKGKHTRHGCAWMDDDDWKIVQDFYALKGCDFKPEVKRFLNDHTRLRVSA